MSMRDLMQMTDDETEAFLDSGRRAQVATVNRDGSPHLVPLSYLFLDGDLAFWTDGDSQKVANLRRDPRVTVLVEEGGRFEEFRAVQVRGTAEVVDDYDTSHRAGL